MMLNANLQDQRSTILPKQKNSALICRSCTTKPSSSVSHSILCARLKCWSLTQKIGRSFTAGRSTTGRSMSVKAEASNHYAAEAIANVLANQPVTVANRDTMGCLINFAQRNADHEQISYTDTIAPILQRSVWFATLKAALGRGRCRAMKWCDFAR